jgi:hypothetical protein
MYVEHKKFGFLDFFLNLFYFIIINSFDIFHHVIYPASVFRYEPTQLATVDRASPRDRE